MATSLNPFYFLKQCYTFYIMEEIEILKINEQAARVPGCIRFDKGSANFPFPEELLPFIDDVKHDIAGRHFGYAAIGGEMLLKERIAVCEQENGRTVSPEDVVVTHGGMSGIYTFLGIATKPGDEVIISEYAFEGFTLAIHSLKLRERRVDFSDHEALRQAITPATKVIILNSPENPTGRVYAQTEIDAIVQIAKEKNVMVLSDEVMHTILYENAQRAVPLLDQEHVIAVNSFSKAWFIPGIRVGWSVSKNAKFNRRMKNSLSVQSVGVNIFGQLLMAHAMAMFDYKTFLRPRMAALTKKRRMMKDLLDENSIGYLCDPQGGMNFYVDLKGDSRKAAPRLLNEYKVAIIPGDIFEGRPSCYARVGFGAVEEDEITRGIASLATALRGDE